MLTKKKKRKLLFFFLIFSVFLINSLEASSVEARKKKSEIEEIEQHLEETPPSSETKETRSIGPFQYSASRTGFSRLLPDISVIGNVAGGWFSEEPNGEVGHDPARTGFTLQEIEVSFQSVIDPYFRADIFLSFFENSVELEEGYFTTLGLPRGLQVRGGKMFLPFGRHNQKHLHAWDFNDNNLVNKYLLGVESLSELGIEVSYLFPTPFFFQVQGTFSNGDNEASFGGGRTKDFLYQGRVSSSFDLGNDTTVLIGSSAAFGFNDTAPGNDTRMFGGDLLVKWKPRAYRSLVWQTEYLNRSKELVAGRQTDGGLYSYVNWQFYRRWYAGLRYDQMGLPEGLVLREYRVSPAITFNPTEFSRLRLQYSYGKVRINDPVHAVFLQMQFNMGPHGAHPL